jgi:hypothetical protein
VLRGFSIAMVCGLVIGTYSSLFIAAPSLYYIRPREVDGVGCTSPAEAVAQSSPVAGGRASIAKGGRRA